jgi:tRNA(Arg) A34 adenosine deaminase TadA
MNRIVDPLDSSFLDEAVRLAAASAARGGGPFGAVVARNGSIIGTGTNRVIAALDPTAHAEVMAIRDACRRLGDYRLTGAVLYASCMPCPMCYAAAYWARIERVYYAASADQAAAAGFDDLEVLQQLGVPAKQRRIPCRQLPSPDADRPFEIWRSLPDRREY